MTEPLDEWVSKHPPVQRLEKNLRSNLDAMTELPAEEKDSLMRVNMIMVRQFVDEVSIE